MADYADFGGSTEPDDALQPEAAQQPAVNMGSVVLEQIAGLEPVTLVERYDQRIYDLTLGRYVYYSTEQPNATPTPDITRPNHSGNLVTTTHEVLVYTPKRGTFATSDELAALQSALDTQINTIANKAEQTQVTSLSTQQVTNTQNIATVSSTVSNVQTSLTALTALVNVKQARFAFVALLNGEGHSPTTDTVAYLGNGTLTLPDSAADGMLMIARKDAASGPSVVNYTKAESGVRVNDTLSAIDELRMYMKASVGWTCVLWLHAAGATVALSSADPMAIDAGPSTPGTQPTASHSDHAHHVQTAAPVSLGWSGAGNLEGDSAALARANHVHDAYDFPCVRAVFVTDETHDAMTEANVWKASVPNGMFAIINGSLYVLIDDVWVHVLTG